jgi:hypothetical protein
MFQELMLFLINPQLQEAVLYRASLVFLKAVLKLAANLVVNLPTNQLVKEARQMLILIIRKRRAGRISWVWMKRRGRILDQACLVSHFPADLQLASKLTSSILHYFDNMSCYFRNPIIRSVVDKFPALKVK